MDLEIRVSGALPQPAIDLAPAAFTARQAAVERAQAITAIESVTDLDDAGAALTMVKSLTRSIEESRKVVKAPVLDIGKRIDAIAKNYSGVLEVEASRLSQMIGAYQEAQKRKAERIREEAAAAQAAALEELSRKQAEAVAAGDADAADRARLEAANAIAEAQLGLIAAEGPRLDNITTRGAWKFEVTSIDELHAAAPHLTVIEPNNAAIRAAIAASKGKAIPGVRIWQEATAIVRKAPSISPDQYDY